MPNQPRPSNGTARDEDVRELTDLLVEWRKTCSQMGLRYTDHDAAEFVVAAGFGRASHA